MPTEHNETAITAAIICLCLKVYSKISTTNTLINLLVSIKCTKINTPKAQRH